MKPYRHTLACALLAVAPALLFAAQPQFALKPAAQPVAVTSVPVFRAPPAAAASGTGVLKGAAVNSMEPQWINAVKKMRTEPFRDRFGDHTVNTVTLGPSHLADGDSRMEIDGASLVWFENEPTVKFPFSVRGQNNQTARNPGKVTLYLHNLRAGSNYVARCSVTEIDPGHEWIVTVGQVRHTVKALSNGDLFFGVEAGGSDLLLTLEAPTYPCPETRPGWCNFHSPFFHGCYLERQ